MVNNNKLIIENKKPFETVYKIKDEYKIPSYEEFMKDYEADEKVNESYEDEVKSYGDIGAVKGYGPVYDPDIKAWQEWPKLHLNSIFSIEYRFDKGLYSERERFFKLGGGEYSTVWRMSGNLSQIMAQQDRIEEGDISVVKQVIRHAGRFSGVSERIEYERTKDEEEEVKRQLRKDIRAFELASRNGERMSPNVSGKFRWEHAYHNVCYQGIQSEYTRSK